MMKKVFPLLVLSLVLGAQTGALAQTNDGEGAAKSDKSVASDHANSQAGEHTAGKKDAKGSAPNKKESVQSKKDEGKAPLSSSTASVAPVNVAGSDVAGPTTDAPAKNTPTVPVGSPLSKEPASASSTARPVAERNVVLTELYRVGPGDVLDIRLLNAQTKESTLFTVMEDGMLEYPLAGDPIRANGLTTDEIDALLTSRVKVYDQPQLAVSVREYASHHVIITGLVSNPGSRVLRREAVPLYVVLAEALPRAEAARATIMRPGTPSMTIDLADTTASATLVIPGDIIKVLAAPPPRPQFFFIGGQVNSPGQKDFHAGLTLTQAVLASGGTTRFASSKVRVSRQAEDGRLVSTEYNLKQIEEGKIPDPTLQPGDRIEIGRSHW